MAIKRKIIKVPKGVVGKICQSQNVGKTTVYAALNYTSNSDDAKLIRQLALNTYGGVETTQVIF